MREVLVAFVLAAGGCAGQEVAMGPRKLEPYPAMTFAAGPEVSDPGLGAWLEAQAGLQVRLPVAVHLDAHRLRIERSSVGALPVHLDDSGLGIALLDHLRRTCPEEGECLVLLVGLWKDGTLVLRKFDGPAEARMSHVEVEVR